MTDTTVETVADVAGRIHGLDWDALEDRLDEQGFAVTAPVLDEDECADLADLFESDRFRATVDMARHRFGDGRYRYFAHPLPDPIQAARLDDHRRHPHGARHHLPRCPVVPNASRRRSVRHSVFRSHCGTLPPLAGPGG